MPSDAAEYVPLRLSEPDAVVSNRGAATPALPTIHQAGDEAATARVTMASASDITARCSRERAPYQACCETELRGAPFQLECFCPRPGCFRNLQFARVAYLKPVALLT